MRLTSVLLLIFLVLKLANLITWSWLWVLSPIWLPLILIVFLLLIARIFLGDEAIKVMKEAIKEGRKR